MPETPEQVYRDAAAVMVGAQGYHVAAGTLKVLVDGWVRKVEFRAAVDVAYRSGFEAGARRMSDHTAGVGVRSVDVRLDDADG